MISDNPVIIFNQLPTVLPFDPQVDLAILKGFLNKHRIPSRIVYWNLRFLEVHLAFYRNSPISMFAEHANDKNLAEFILAPFLYKLLLDDKSAHRDPATQCRIDHKLHKLYLAYSKFEPLELTPISMIPGILTSLLQRYDKVIRQEIDAMHEEKPVLWAISHVYNQWIPGLLIFKIMKTRFPTMKLLIGGFVSEEEAVTFMHTFPDIDYVIWGEGEYPLLYLINHLEKRTEISLDEIPRLAFRTEHGDVTTSGTVADPYESPKDSERWAHDDYRDFFLQLDRTNFRSQLRAICYSHRRGCYWAKCKFCILHKNSPLREKPMEMVLDDVEHLIRDFDARNIIFACQSLLPQDRAKAHEFLDHLIRLRAKYKTLLFFSNIMKRDVSESMVDKFVEAGFQTVGIGFEATSDVLLRKMRKNARFIDNINGVKLFLKRGISVHCNILLGIPNETETDIIESILNLHYLRFFFGDPRMILEIVPMQLSKGAPFELEMSDMEKREWNKMDCFTVYEHLPSYIQNTVPRFLLGTFVRRLEHEELWKRFEIEVKRYQNKRYDYKWFKKGSLTILREFREGSLIQENRLEPIQLQMLKLANTMTTLDRLCSTICAETPVSVTEVKRHVKGLKGKSLLYCDDKQDKMVSVVDTDLIA